jgi:hypothetical protein
MAGSTVLGFPKVTNSKKDDVLYLLRGTGADRDKQVNVQYLLANAFLENRIELLEGGNVSEQATPDMTALIPAGRAYINGVYTDWEETSTDTITAPITNPQLLYILIDQTGAISTLAGTEAVNPTFPALPADKIILGAIYLKVATTSLNDNVELFNFYHDPNGFNNNILINSSTSFSSGRLDFTNLIIDAAVTLNATTKTGIQYLNTDYFHWNLSGNFFITANGSIGLPSTHNIENNGNNGADGLTTSPYTGGAGGVKGYKSGINAPDLNFSSGIGGNGTGIYINVTGSDVTSAGAGGGGASLIAAGGKGGNGASIGNPTPTGSTAAINRKAPLLIIKSLNKIINGNINLSGADGVDGFDGGSGFDMIAGSPGSGGNAGGIIILIASLSVLINAGVTVTAKGGDGGDGGDAIGSSINNIAGSGGGGAGGGLIFIRSSSFTNTGTLTSSKGIKGTGGTASGGTSNNINGNDGVDGEDGITDQKILEDMTVSDVLLPNNLMDINLKKIF